jgi:hypothetical protein
MTVAIWMEERKQAAHRGMPQQRFLPHDSRKNKTLKRRDRVINN